MSNLSVMCFHRGACIYTDYKLVRPIYALNNFYCAETETVTYAVHWFFLFHMLCFFSPTKSLWKVHTEPWLLLCQKSCSWVQILYRDEKWAQRNVPLSNSWIWKQPSSFESIHPILSGGLQSCYNQYFLYKQQIKSNNLTLWKETTLSKKDDSTFP